MDRIQLRRDTSARWAEINPILLEGEVGYEIDTKLRKIGDGASRWNDLEYLKAEGISQETGNSQNITMSQDAITRELNKLGSKIGDNIEFNLHKTNNSKTIDIPFKIGDSLLLEVSELESDGARNVAIYDENLNLLFVAYNEGTQVITINQNVKKIIIRANTDSSATYVIAVGSLTFGQKYELYDIDKQFKEKLSPYSFSQGRLREEDGKIIESNSGAVSSYINAMYNNVCVETFGEFRIRNAIKYNLDYTFEKVEIKATITNKIILPQGGIYRIAVVNKDNTSVINPTDINSNIIISNYTPTNVIRYVGMNETFDLSTDNPYKQIFGEFKAGDTLNFSVVNYNISGSGDSNVGIYDENGDIIDVFYSKREKEIKLTKDTNYISIKLGYVSTVSYMQASCNIMYGSVSQDIHKINERTTNLENNSKFKDSYEYKTSLSIDNRQQTIDIPLKKGYSFILSVKNLTVDGNGQYNVHVRAVYEDETFDYLAIAYNDGVIEKIIEKDCQYIVVSVVIAGEISNIYADVVLKYGGFATKVEKEEFEEYKKIVNKELEDLNDIPNILKVDKNMIYETKGAVTNWIYTPDIYVGYNNPMKKDCILSKIEVEVFKPIEPVGKTMDVLIGTIDQRNWFLPRVIYSVPIVNLVSLNKGILTLDANGMYIGINANEVVFLRGKQLSVDQPNVTFGLSTKNFDNSNKLVTTRDLLNAVTYNETENLSHYKLEVIDVDSMFASKEEIESVETTLESVGQQLSKINKYTDLATGDSYEIKVINGQIILQTLEFKKILVIGHSFVVYNNSPSADWYLDDGENRAMAPSINAHQWTTFVKDAYNAQLTIKGGVDFERNYSVDYDFAAKWNITDNYDAICVYLNENAVYNDTMQASWEAMLRYLISAAPSAKIYCTGSWQSSKKETAIRNACNSVNGVEYVDCVGLYYSGNIWKKGDYYLGRGGEYYPMGAPYSHPNDIGHFEIANKFLEVMGKQPIGGLVHITLNQSNGGTISTPNTTWLPNGIVTIRIEALEGYIIDSVNVVDSNGLAIEAIKRTNTMYDGTERVYYTFTMPNDNVVVTPTWRLL